MTTLAVSGYYLSTSQFNENHGWFTSMVLMSTTRLMDGQVPTGWWWHQQGEEVNASVRY